MSLHYNADNSYLFVNGKEVLKFKADNKNVNFPTQFCLGSISNGFSASESRDASLNKNVYDFSVNYNFIDKSDISKIHMNPVELKYYPLVVSIDKCTEDCNVLSPKICVPKETYIKAFKMITNKNEAKAMIKHISCDCKCKFNSTTGNSNQKWNNRTCQYECKNYRECIKDYSWNPIRCICENSKYLKSIVDTSVTECDEVIIAMDNVSTKKTKKTNTIATDVTDTASINFHSKKVRDCYVLHTVLLVIILLLINIIICYYFANQKGTIQNGK